MIDCYLEQGDQRQPIPGNKPVSIGSGEACTLRLGVEGVEEEHVIVRRDGDQVVLQSQVAGEQDVRVNGVAVHAASLDPGDKLAFGDLQATFEMADDEQPRMVVGDATYELVRGVNSIGRDPEGNVELDHESVSRKHAALLILPSGQILMRDLGSANGTFVNGRRLGEMDLSDGDEIRIGDAVLHLRREQSEQQVQSASTASETAGPARSGGPPLAATVVRSLPDTPDADSNAAEAAGPKLELELDGNKTELNEGTATIGRGTDCTIVIDNDPLVSRHHAEVEVSGSLVMLRDLDSSNGTRLNDEVIPRAQPLNDGDRIGIGGKEIKYSAEVPVTPFGQTMVAKDLPGAAGRTVLAPTADADGIPTDRASALRVLELGADAGEQEIQQRYRELYSEFQVRLTNAPTAELKATYQKRVDALRAALGLLAPQSGAGADSDLPALEPVEGDASEGAASAAEIESDEADDERTGAEPATTGKTKPGKRSKSGAEAKLPKSTLVIGGVAAAILIGVIIAGLGAIRASRAAAALQAELAAKTEERQEMEAAIPETTEALESLAQGKGQLVEQNLELKICNHSVAPLTWVWLNVAQFDAERGGFKSFDTAYDTSWEYLYYSDPIAPDSAFGGGRWVVGEERVWDGSALFFAARFEYRGIEVLRAGAMPAFGGDCYPLNLDR